MVSDVVICYYFHLSKQTSGHFGADAMLSLSTLTGGSLSGH